MRGVGYLDNLRMFVVLMQCVVPLANGKITAINKWPSAFPNSITTKTNDQKSASVPDIDNWLTWSNWSECSKTCDGGATFQYRHCREKDDCPGPNIRYKLCNTQPCPDYLPDFRSQQCSAYNNIAFKGQLYKWMPYISTKKPCALICRSEDEGISREMAPKVLDGTRCYDGSLDMCINGECMPVGCDLKLGSLLKLDVCGICGGDGSFCAKQSTYQWHQSDYSPCSQPCGGGHESTSVLCQDSSRGVTVDVLLCNSTREPEPLYRQCNMQTCDPTAAVTKYKPSKMDKFSHAANGKHHSQYQWHAEAWGPCTNDCGGGTQARRVFCSSLLANGSRTMVGEFKCMRQTQLMTEKTCNDHTCPKWQTSNWSSCSATCGKGTQIRTVSCVDHKGFDQNDQCDKMSRPVDRQTCKVSSHCSGHDKVNRHSSPSLKWMQTSVIKSPDPFDLPHSEQALPLVASNPYQWTDDQADNNEALKYEDTPMFSAGPWSECSVTCGHGFRHRTVECKLYIKFSVKLVQLPDSECSDTKPDEREACSKRPCHDSDMSSNMNNMTWTSVGQSANDGDKSVHKSNGMGIDVTYSWYYRGSTPCSRTCLGGIRYSMIRCLRDHDQSPVEDKLCQNVRRPPELKQTCNDVPCPPRWNTSDFTPCTHTCGGGVQTRTVQCVQEFGADPGDVLTMPMDSCPYPPPRTQMTCNPLDCPAMWDASLWSACSATCGKGIMQRSVVCRQRMASGDVRDILEDPEKACSKPKLSHRKACYMEACSGSNGKHWPAKSQKVKPALHATSSVIRNRGKANKLRVGGSAERHEGTDLRLKCPVYVAPGHPRPVVKWLKDGRPMTFSKSQKAHFKMSALGAVKIKSLRRADAGTYTCISGRVRESIKLTVIPRGGISVQPSYDHMDFMTSKRPPFMGTNSNSIQRFYANSTDALRILQTASQRTTQSPLSSNSVNTDISDNNYIDTNAKEYHGQLDQLDVTPSTWTQEMDFRTAISTVLSAFRSSDGAGRVEMFLDEPLLYNEIRDKLVLWSKFQRHKLSFEWRNGQWSSCSKTCGSDGFQTRTIDCVSELDQDEKLFKPEICATVGLTPAPAIQQECGSTDCPEWRTGPWDECEKSECFALDTALQTRNVNCTVSNGTIVAPELCLTTRPRDKRDCTNYKCKAVWTTGPWSQCTVSCGANGIRSRILKCVWYGSSRPAGNMCRTLERPSVKESCEEVIQCPTAGEPACRDHFKYCDYANSLKLCKQKAYRLRCCRTCSSHPSQR